MKFSLATLVPLAALAPRCSANFDVYKVGESLFGNVIDRWAIFDNDPSCNDVVHRYPNFAEYSRVNGDQTGVRCQGACGREDRADGIEQLEMNFEQDPLYHWTIYRDRGYSMYGLDGNVYGECILFPGNSFNCPAGGGPMVGHRKFRCLTQFSASQITGV